MFTKTFFTVSAMFFKFGFISCIHTFLAYYIYHNYKAVSIT